LFDVRAAADVSLVPDRLFMRVSGVSRSQDGYVNRYDYGCTHPSSGIPNNGQQADCFLGTEGGKSYQGGRVGLRFVASDNVEINLSADAIQDNSEVAAVVLEGVNPSAFGALASAQYGIPYDARFLPPNQFTSYASFGGRTGTKTYQFEPKTSTYNYGTALARSARSSSSTRSAATGSNRPRRIRRTRS